MPCKQTDVVFEVERRAVAVWKCNPKETAGGAGSELFVVTRLSWLDVEVRSVEMGYF